jgi:putative transposase
LLRSDGWQLCRGLGGRLQWNTQPKYSVSNVVGYIKGKSAIQIARKYGGRQRNFTGENFWARGYYVSTVGLDEAMVRAYIRHQEAEDERYDQMKLVE